MGKINKMKNIFFTSDLHFGHKNVIEYSKRPFSSVEEMDEMLISNWNNVVSQQDEVYLLGDVSLTTKEKTLKLLKRLVGQIYLVKGNHDKKTISGDCVKRFGWIKDYYELSVPDEDANRGEQKIILSHYPFLTWNRSHHCSWSLHGHSHGSLPDDPYARRLDIGVDAHNYEPVSYERIKTLMAKKIFRPVDHHKERNE